MENVILKLTSHEFSLLCDDFESGDFHVGISLDHEENVCFVKELIDCVKIEPGVDFHENNVIYFNFSLNLVQVDKLKVWVEWSYKESFDCYLHSEDKVGFIKLRNKILNL